MKIRKASRLILLDKQNRILLFKIKDPFNPGLDEFWVTPGGGVDEEESFEAAARRELWEETGIQEAKIGPWVWTREAEFNWEDGRVKAHERYFLAWVKETEITLDHFTPLEKESYREHHWWELEELSRTDDVMFPGKLSELLRPLLAGSLPEKPIVID